MHWFSDAGHAWLRVNRKKLKELNIQDKISIFSYQKGNNVYLEEDCDASIFLEHYFKNPKWYESENLKTEFKKIPVKNCKKYSKIRTYQIYRKEG